MKISIAQIDSTSDKDDNLRKIRGMTQEGASSGARVVVFPEFAMFEHTALDINFVEASEPLDGAFVAAAREIAREIDVWIVVPFLEKIEGDEDRASNTTLAINPEGEIEAVYRKVHLYDAFGLRESDIIRPGTDLEAVTFDVDGVRFGISTCYDLRFPEIYRLLVDAGSEIVLNVASWTPGVRKEDHWSTLSRARAIENTIYFLSVSQAPPISTGGSLLVDPMGIIVGELGEKPAVGTYDIDPQRVASVRLTNPCLANRRYTIKPLS